MSGVQHAEKFFRPDLRHPPVHPPMLQRKCACGGSSGFTGNCPECEQHKLTGNPLQTRLRVSEPGDAYEQEADRIAAAATTNDDFTRDDLRSGAVRQTRLAAGTAAFSGLQRQAMPSEKAASESDKGSDTGPSEEESRCPSWRADPESISKRAAENYVQNDMTPPSQAKVERIDCEPPNSLGNYGCYVHFSDGLVIRVIVRAKDVVVGTGPGPFTTLTPPPATPLCFYDYDCPEGQLVLTKRECKSAKPAAGPPMVAQRHAAPGATRAMNAAPIVGEVLSSAGQPLDGATREFFSAQLGHDFSNVRVHVDDRAAESARSINALAYTVGSHVVFDSGQYAPGTRAGQRLLAHELTHVVQQGGSAPLASQTKSCGTPAAPSVTTGPIQRQPKSEEPSFRDLPILLGKLELDVGKNLQDYGHHLYQAATLHSDEPEALQNALTRYALGANVLKTSFRFAGFKPETADKLALGTGILFKSLTFIRQGELALDFQVDIGRGLKFETNLNLNMNPRDLTEVRKAGVNFGLVRRF